MPRFVPDLRPICAGSPLERAAPAIRAQANTVPDRQVVPPPPESFMLALLLAALMSFGLVQAGDLPTRLQGLLSQLETSQGATTWDLARELRDVAGRDSASAAPLLVTAAGTSSEPVKLIIGETLVDISAADAAAGILLPLVGGPHSQEALALLSNRSFRDVPSVGDKLAERLSQPLPADQRIDLARTLYQASSDKVRQQARGVLLDALQSDDADTRAMAALALAEIKDYTSARPVLKTLESDPGPRGQLARAYLEVDKQIEYYVSRTTRQADTVSPRTSAEIAAPAAPGGIGSLDVLDELIKRVQDNHLMGEQLQGPAGREFLITAAAKGMLAALDPHSTYFSSKEYERWILDLRRNYAGIGAYVDTIDDDFTITRPIYSGPAYKAGLLSGDRIYKVDGWDTHGQSNDEIIRRLKGDPDTEVKISVLRAGWTELRDYVIKRAVIHIDSVTAEMLPGNIGYADVGAFAENTSLELLNALNDLRKQGMRGMILDLRNNSGGYLEEAVKLTSLFVQPGSLVVYTEGRAAKHVEYQAVPVKGRWDGPLVVLVNGRSASASEIVSGALQDMKRATLVGELTYGKGSVQQAMPMDTRPGDTLKTDLNYNGVYDPGDEYEDLDHDGQYTYPVSVKITNARYYLPSGRSIHTELDLEGKVVKQGGVTPEKEVAFKGLEPWENNEIAQLYDALLKHVPQGEKFKDPFQTYVDEHFDTNPALFRELAQGDNKDITRYPDFEKLRASLADTHLPDDTLRRLLRARLRDRVADDRGRPFPGGFLFGDWQEDSQLQEAIRVVGRAASVNLADIEGYKAFANDVPPETKPADSALPH
jgi:C-terminal peptidase prc